MQIKLLFKKCRRQRNVMEKWIRAVHLEDNQSWNELLTFCENTQRICLHILITLIYWQTFLNEGFLVYSFLLPLHFQSLHLSIWLWVTKLLIWTKTVYLVLTTFKQYIKCVIELHTSLKLILIFMTLKVRMYPTIII